MDEGPAPKTPDLPTQPHYVLIQIQDDGSLDIEMEGVYLWQLMGIAWALQQQADDEAEAED